MNDSLALLILVVAAVSLFISQRSTRNGSFFHGRSASGSAPGLLTLIFSQVTTWIFARSLLNAAILGFHYGLWGTLAYAAYYLSFLSGALIIDHLRFRRGHGSIQAFLRERFGPWGTRCYNLVIGVRLVSEVFANLLVVGILFGATGSLAYTLAILAVSLVTLVYSMLGGLHASLRTDLFQMLVFLGVLGLLMFFAIGGGHFSSALLEFRPFAIEDPGPVLLLVALLQVWSYPMHDPVMMDRGFLADRRTTWRSFVHASWIATLCILAFGSLGVIAGANALGGEEMNQTLTRLLGEGPMWLFSASLLISAMSTLDSALSSAAKLVILDMGLASPRVNLGRAAMALFMLAGLALVFWGNRDLFAAVAVSGTASMYLAPVVFFSLWGDRREIPLWSYLGSFALALAGATLYFTESSGHSALLGDAHKYTKLLWISLVVLLGGCLLFQTGGLLASGNRGRLQLQTRTQD